MLIGFFGLFSMTLFQNGLHGSEWAGFCHKKTKYFCEIYKWEQYLRDLLALGPVAQYFQNLPATDRAQ